MFLLQLRGLKKGVQRGQLDDGADRQIAGRLQAAAPLAAVDRRFRQPSRPKSHPDSDRLRPTLLGQVSLGGAIAQPEIGWIARTRRPGMSQHDNMIGLPDPLAEITLRRPRCHGQAAQQKQEDQQLSMCVHGWVVPYL
jgi:hypothetical protein